MQTNHQAQSVLLTSNSSLDKLQILNLATNHCEINDVSDVYDEDEIYQSKIIDQDGDDFLKSDDVSSSSVKFEMAVKVVLIPCRHEYKAANCDLWWCREDFVFFQQSAISEVRMYAAMEGIEFREAKKRLYQPDQDEKMSGRVLSHLMITSPYISSSFNNKNTSSANNLGKKDDVALTNQDELLGLRKSNGVFQSAKNLACLSHPENNARVDDEDDHNQNILYRRQSSFAAERRDCQDLYLCVPLNKPVKLIFSKPRSRPDSSSNSLFAVMGIFSFALPLVGYYLFNSYQ